MKNVIKHIIFWNVLMLTFISSLGQSIQIIKQDTFVAGEPVILEFGLSIGFNAVLHCHSALGSVVLNPIEGKTEPLQFRLPDFMAHKSGAVSWYLPDGDIEFQGNIVILPEDSVENMETYLGPPDILAGGKDYSMFVSVPIDKYDNPMPEQTQVNLEYYFKGDKARETLYIEDGVVFYRIFSPDESGRVFAVSECLNTYSKEYDVNIQPNLPTDFSIYAEGYHRYADGNQILMFNTSVLTDTFSNVISDGTMVEFYIKNNEGDVLRTRGVTQNGVALAEIVHPEYTDDWEVKAFVQGMAESNTIVVNFEQVVKTYNVEFSKNNRQITLGPVQSYMNQRVPDGFKADMSLFKEGILVKRTLLELQNGYVTFTLDPNEIKSGVYDIHFEVAGIDKTFQKIKL